MFPPTVKCDKLQRDVKANLRTNYNTLNAILYLQN